MANQEHRIITELEVDGVIYRETKTLTPVVTSNAWEHSGTEEQEIVCTRSIGDKSYSVRKIISTDTENEETTMTWDEVQAFKEDWSKNWNPMDIPTPRIFLPSMNDSWMSTFCRLFCLNGLVLVFVWTLSFGHPFVYFVYFVYFVFCILDMHRSNMWI